MSTSVSYAAAILLTLLASSSNAFAKPLSEEKAKPRVIATQTAWLPDAGRVFLVGGFDNSLRPSGYASIGLGGIAELGLSTNRQRSEAGEEAKLSMAHFKMGTPEGFGHRLVPALSLSYRKTLPSEVQFLARDREFEVAVLGATASKKMGPVSLHIGAELFSAKDEDAGLELQKVIRPTLGIEWHPGELPLTTLVADLHWLPGSDEPQGIATRWNVAWGVRYQSLDWASIDLNLRHQEGESISDAIITLGLSGSFSVLKPDLSLDRSQAQPSK